ncbi:lipoyl domain-containing protein [Saccharopolyspora sp. NPDC049357]|uniref:lipoyl domain-containing protein n=1 Tax=Saccharopolyspora sp. NPDC049357 TaxID=3154507 RepID=UPI00343FD62F
MTDLHLPGERTGPARWRLVRWLASDGSGVRAGQPLAELRPAETDGAAIRVSALATGTLWHQVKRGEVLHVGQVIGLIE